MLYTETIYSKNILNIRWYCGTSGFLPPCIRKCVESFQCFCNISWKVFSSVGCEAMGWRDGHEKTWRNGEKHSDGGTTLGSMYVFFYLFYILPIGFHIIKCLFFPLVLFFVDVRIPQSTIVSYILVKGFWTLPFYQKMKVGKLFFSVSWPKLICESGKGRLTVSQLMWFVIPISQLCDELIDCFLIYEAKLVAVGYGIKKLQIMMTIVDDLVSVDTLIEEHLTVEPANEYIQSCDIVAFNKICKYMFSW